MQKTKPKKFIQILEKFGWYPFLSSVNHLVTVSQPLGGMHMSLFICIHVCSLA